MISWTVKLKMTIWKDPIVLALPIGYEISSLKTDEFVSVLNTDQVNAMQRALYYKRGKIEVVPV